MTGKSGEQKAAESEVEGFKESLGPFVVAAETTRMAMLFADAKRPHNPIIFANDSFLSLTGYDREEVLGKSFNFLMARGADADALARIQAEFEGGSDCGVEVLYRRKDGSEFWAALFVSPVKDENGDTVQYFASFANLTKHKEEQIQSRMLIDELNHRVKNILATVQSIVWQALRTSADPKVIQDSIESRLFALSRSHDLLTRENWKSAGLQDIVFYALEPFGVTGGPAKRFVIQGENIRFPPPAALALGIAFNELATNAMKYGALSNETGSILIEWKIEPAPEGDRLLLHWQERDGPPVTPPSHKGFGSSVIERGLAHELQAITQLDYRPKGLECTLTFLRRGAFIMDRLLSGRRILVVEDEMLIVMMIEALLADMGCEAVTTAATVDQAVSLIEEQVFDAAMLDVNLNGINSRSVADALAARGVPFVFCTGNNAHRAMDGYEDRPVLRKPFTNKDLIAALTKLFSP